MQAYFIKLENTGKGRMFHNLIMSSMVGENFLIWWKSIYIVIIVVSQRFTTEVLWLAHAICLLKQLTSEGRRFESIFQMKRSIALHCSIFVFLTECKCISNLNLTLINHIYKGFICALVSYKGVRACVRTCVWVGWGRGRRKGHTR